MKPRIRVIQADCKFNYEYELDASPPEVDFIAQQFVNGIANREFNRDLQELTKFPTVHFSTVETALHMIVVTAFVVASLYWAFIEVSKL